MFRTTAAAIALLVGSAAAQPFPSADYNRKGNCPWPTNNINTAEGYAEYVEQYRCTSNAECAAANGDGYCCIAYQVGFFCDEVVGVNKNGDNIGQCNPTNRCFPDAGEGVAIPFSAEEPDLDEFMVSLEANVQAAKDCAGKEGDEFDACFKAIFDDLKANMVTMTDDPTSGSAARGAAGAAAVAAVAAGAALLN